MRFHVNLGRLHPRRQAPRLRQGTVGFEGLGLGLIPEKSSSLVSISPYPKPKTGVLQDPM